MWSKAREIAAGDLVIIWLTRESLQPLLITPGKELNGRYGVYSHSDLIGVQYGSKVSSRNGKGFIHVLRPTPELWTRALPHRTQILYVADIALITSWLGIKPGSIVAEAGTGSASFSHSLARTIGSKGHLYTYEFHAIRASKARDEFIAHGMGDRITLTHRNVCKDGFGLIDAVDSIFLDLPAPWEAIPHAKIALRRDQISRICCFSPCIEQVLRTVSSLNAEGFTDITMYETLIRPYELQQPNKSEMIGIDDVKERLKRAEVKKEERRLRQIERSKAEKEKNTLKRKRDEDGEPGADADVERKRIKDGAEHDGDGADDEDLQGENVASTSAIPGFPVDVVGAPTSADAALPPQDIQPRTRSASPSSPPPTPISMVLAKPIAEVRGHTSYLTFARLLPPAEEKSNSSDIEVLLNAT